MNAKALPRCEWRFGERSFCEEHSTQVVSRIDAIRDWWYLCEEHAARQEQLVAAMGSPIIRDPRSSLSTETVLSWWPPRHRAASKVDAQRYLEATR